MACRTSSLVCWNVEDHDGSGSQITGRGTWVVSWQCSSTYDEPE